MQNFRSMAAGSSGSGRIFAGDRRMWPHPNQALKCPRCDSLNTKFCYYNNYNLSQPRHFCKSCRRYWTKGGVLRNVPVGGGCRKTKRLKPKSLPDSQKDRKTTPPRHHAGSESSDLTATATETAAAEISATSASDLLHLGDFTLQNPKNLASSAMESLDPASDSDVFAAAGSFSGLTTATNSGASLGFGFSDFSPSFRVYNNYNTTNNNYNNNNDNNYNNNNKISSLVGLEEPKMPELTAGYLAQTATGEIPAPQERQVNGGLTALGWQGNGEPGLFDMASVDQGYYWGQTQWGETDQSLFLP